jgi:hypothetical protein
MFSVGGQAHLSDKPLESFRSERMITQAKLRFPRARADTDHSSVRIFFA